MQETIEILQTIERLQTCLEELSVRGLRSAGPRDLKGLSSLREEFQRIGADHLAERITTVIDAVRNDDRSAAAGLLRAQASLRLFERILTLDVAQDALRTALPTDETAASDEVAP